MPNYRWTKRLTDEELDLEIRDHQSRTPSDFIDLTRAHLIDLLLLIQQDRVQFRKLDIDNIGLKNRLRNLEMS